MEPYAAALAVANGVVAALNLIAWSETRESRDAVATVAWVGSMLYWVLRGVL